MSELKLARKSNDIQIPLLKDEDISSMLELYFSSAMDLFKGAAFDELDLVHKSFQELRAETFANLKSLADEKRGSPEGEEALKAIRTLQDCADQLLNVLLSVERLQTNLQTNWPTQLQAQETESSGD